MDVIQNLLIVGLSLSQATLILSLEFPKIKIEKNYSGFLFMTTGTIGITQYFVSCLEFSQIASTYNVQCRRHCHYKA